MTPRVEMNHYVIEVRFKGDEYGAREFARELEHEFAGTVELKETTPDGMVVRTIPHELKIGRRNG